MKNNNHTKGEWHLESVNGIKFIQDKDNRFLATVHSLEDGKNNDERRKESEANAKLIVKVITLKLSAMASKKEQQVFHKKDIGIYFKYWS